jgi:hypothetical protein
LVLCAAPARHRLGRGDVAEQSTIFDWKRSKCFDTNTNTSYMRKNCIVLGAATTVLLLPHRHGVVHENMHITINTGISHSLTQLTSPRHSKQRVHTCHSAALNQAPACQQPQPLPQAHDPTLPWECNRLNQGTAAPHHNSRTTSPASRPGSAMRSHHTKLRSENTQHCQPAVTADTTKRRPPAKLAQLYRRYSGHT